jgi:hypothetical protein
MSQENLDLVRGSCEREDLRFGPTWETIDPGVRVPHPQH